MYRMGSILYGGSGADVGLYVRLCVELYVDGTAETVYPFLGDNLGDNCRQLVVMWEGIGRIYDKITHYIKYMVKCR